MYKYLFCLVWVSLLQGSSCISITAGVGPGWHQLFIHEKFKLSPAATNVPIEDLVYPNIENIGTEFNTLPFGRAKISLNYPLFCAEYILSGGKTKHGAGSVSYSVMQTLTNPNIIIPVDYITIAKLGINVFINDFCIGGVWQGEKNPLQAIFKLGYVYNKEQVTFNPLDKAAIWKINNTWHGPYIGFTGIIQWDKTTCAFWYKCVLGSVKSHFSVCAAPDFFTNIEQLFILPLESSPTRWKGATIGSLFGAELTYDLCSRISVGSTLDYLLYSIRKGPRICFSRPQPLVNTACVQQQIWQQIAWTFWLELYY